MKLLLAFAGVFAVLMMVLSMASGGAPAQAIEPVETATRAPDGDPICKEGPDEGDEDTGDSELDNDDGGDEPDDGDSDDPPNVTPDTDGVQGLDPSPTRDYWDGFDHDDELDDCSGPRETEAPVSTTPEPSPTPSGTVTCVGTDVSGCEASDGEVDPSDANCDGGVDGSDALAVLSYASGGGAGCTGNGGSGDADCNGDVDTVDAVRILTQAAGLDEASC